jgi:hypothetical protein
MFHLVSEKCGQYGRILANPIRRALGDDLAEVEDVDPVADGHDKVHVVFDEHDRWCRSVRLRILVY